MIQDQKPQHCCPYCTHDKGSRYAVKRHKKVCRMNPVNQGSTRYVVR